MKISLHKLVASVLLLGLTTASARIYQFETSIDVFFFEMTGGVEIDDSRGLDSGKSLKIPPGGEASLNVINENRGGYIEFWVYDDMTIPADALAERVGPQFGLVQANGRVFTIGSMYGADQSGDSVYVASEFVSSWVNMQTLGSAERREGWNQWIFDLDPIRGFKIYLNGENVNEDATYFDWSKTGLIGFTGIVIYGDEESENPQTIWVDNLNVEVKGQMAIAPNDRSVLPEQDPVYEGPGIPFNPELAGKHPRLLFDEDGLERIRNYYNSAAGTVDRDELRNYLGASVAPLEPAFLKDATDGQRQGLWRMPTVALHYALTGDATSFERTVDFMELLIDLPHWEMGSEKSSGMSAANIMIGAALAYDWLYHDLDPEFRERYRQKLWMQARTMYHGGHLQKNPSTGYWQSDPGNNHRWHRDAGLALCALAAYTGEEDQKWLMGELLQEMEFVTDWLPEDGTSHEASSYLVFGLPHLSLATQAMDRCMGTDYLDLPFFFNTGAFRLQSLAPGLGDGLVYGDDSSGLGSYSNAFYLHASHHKQSDVLAGLDLIRDKYPSAFSYSWMALVWRDPTVPTGTLEDLPKASLFSDLGVSFFRDGWESEDAGAMFKSGPFGGVSLNEYRDTNDFSYINVAHDDPDANSFIIWKDGALVAETSRYSYSKASANHNTILVNGKGQTAVGRGEGGKWTQPASGNNSMKDMGIITAWKTQNEIKVVEGEAAGSYPGSGLQSYRRTFVWKEGSYILVLDSIEAGAAVEIDWLVQSGTVELLDEVEQTYLLANNGSQSKMQLVCSEEYTTSTVISPADQRGEPLGWEQLRATVETSSVRYASLYLPWGGELDVAVDFVSEQEAQVTVSGEGVEDVWHWEIAPDNTHPSSLRLLVEEEVMFDLGAKSELESFVGEDVLYAGLWMHSPWFGWISTKDHFPWIEHRTHGWLYGYADVAGEGAKMLYDKKLGWIWTTASIYPWMYQSAEERWIYFLIKHGDDRWFATPNEEDSSMQYFPE